MRVRTGTQPLKEGPPGQGEEPPHPHGANRRGESDGNRPTWAGARGSRAPRLTPHPQSPAILAGGSMGGEKQGRGRRVGTGGPSRTRLLQKSRRDLPPIALPCRNGAVSGSGIPRRHAVLPGGFLPPPELAPTSYLPRTPRVSFVAAAARRLGCAPGSAGVPGGSHLVRGRKLQLIDIEGRH